MARERRIGAESSTHCPARHALRAGLFGAGGVGEILRLPQRLDFGNIFIIKAS